MHAQAQSSSHVLLVACSGTSGATEHNNNGVTLLHEGKPAEAIAELDKAIELNPELAVAYNNRGRAYGELGSMSRPWPTTPRPSS